MAQVIIDYDEYQELLAARTQQEREKLTYRRREDYDPISNTHTLVLGIWKRDILRLLDIPTTPELKARIHILED